MKKIVLALVAVTGMYACSQKKTEKVIDSASTAVTAADTDSLSYSYDSVKVYGKARVSSNKLVTDTAKAVVVYPVFQDQTVNKFLEDRVIGISGKQGLSKSYKELTTGFIKEYDTYIAANKGSEETWFQKLDMKVKANYPNYISVLLVFSDYKGGAHPNYLFTYFNYNPKTYQTITLDSIITADGMPKLRAIGENIFRRNENLAPNASLSEGYFFDQGVFTLPETFTLTKEGIKFLYNPYEIKAYAAGTTELLVPFSKINDIMKESSVLINFK
ncbi:DUF3298 domain-containing protein [Pedobacter sp. MC2016-15]|uniref:DUF3298 and DUF4163 domain-containing protein n=1 Tax=Pedobacter sp. MC2016-15 TaxID=2994473 RepID=UPI0022451CA7|nr:DUF3298 and DUF4163 domain-containing protein [Pedobacter sp. MC2016-15]MCX2479642.1 DUF3298 domain-containing protein [Pedobacter sp. MC2016-15]